MRVPGISRRKFGDFLLLGVTSAELVLLFFVTSTFAIADWIYVSGHLFVLGDRPYAAPARGKGSLVALQHRRRYSLRLSLCPDGLSPVGTRNPAWPPVGLVLVALAACLSFASLLSLGRWFESGPPCGVWQPEAHTGSCAIRCIWRMCFRTLVTTFMNLISAQCCW